jgi:hypothetical protein
MRKFGDQILRHAVAALQVAAIGDGYAQIIQMAVAIVDEL